VLTLAFDTATNVATSALLEDGKLLGERTGLPARLLEDVDDLLTSADAEPAELERIVVGTGPGELHGRMDRCESASRSTPRLPDAQRRPQAHHPRSR
jgi:hypothetical protein